MKSCDSSTTKRFWWEVLLGISLLHFSQQPCSSFANNDATVKTFNYQQIPNIFTLFVGYPGTGKSALVGQGATSPVLTIGGQNDNLLIGRATSSALVKQISENSKAYVVSSEIYDVLNKLLKSVDETASLITCRGLQSLFMCSPTPPRWCCLAKPLKTVQW